MTVIADAKGGKATVEFEKKGDVLVSKTKLPEGDGYNLVVQFKQTADAKPQNFRFKLETAHLRRVQARGIRLHLRTLRPSLGGIRALLHQDGWVKAMPPIANPRSSNLAEDGEGLDSALEPYIQSNT